VLAQTTAPKSAQDCEAGKHWDRASKTCKKSQTLQTQLPSSLPRPIRKRTVCGPSSIGAAGEIASAQDDIIIVEPNSREIALPTQ
jgi:hypothetical protein